MVVIRLSRGGTKNRPFYKVTVADSRKWRDGRFIEVIGTYDPRAKGTDRKVVVMDMEKFNGWVKKGAQPTDRVKHVMKLAQAAK